jgi:hypothetical protein
VSPGDISVQRLYTSFFGKCCHEALPCLVPSSTTPLPSSTSTEVTTTNTTSAAALPAKVSAAALTTEAETAEAPAPCVTPPPPATTCAPCRDETMEMSAVGETSSRPDEFPSFPSALLDTTYHDRVLEVRHEKKEKKKSNV